MTKKHHSHESADDQPTPAESVTAPPEPMRVIVQQTGKPVRIFQCSVPVDPSFSTIEIHAVDEPEAKRMYLLAFGEVPFEILKFPIKVTELPAAPSDSPPAA